MTESVCPRCGSEVVYNLTCHTYGSDEGGWFACMPCDSAIEYVCVRQYDDDPPEPVCDWRYTHGLNPRNPRAAANEACRPSWIPQGLSVVQPVQEKPLPLSIVSAVSGVRAIWDHRESDDN